MKPSAREWFKFQNSADDPTTVEIHVIDIIGGWDEDFLNRLFGEQIFGVTARAFVEQLAALPADVKNIQLHINSPGGDVQGAINIANALRDQQVSKGRSVTTIVDGMAASAASIIAMAGSTVVMNDNALLMIHNPWTFAIGSAAEMRKVADVLDTMRGQAIKTYQWHSAMSDDEIAALMDAETWMDADEAIANSFATEKVSGLAAAALDPKAVASLKVPEKFRARVDALLRKEPPAPKAASASDVLAAVEAAGLTTGFARELLAANLSTEQVTARIDTAKAARTAAEARATKIRALCTTATLPQLADGYIAGAMSIDDVQAHLTTVTAAMHKAEIDTGLAPNAGGRSVKTHINVADVYRDRNLPKH